MLRIGISACFFHADPTRPIFKGKTLLYLEQSLAHWIQSRNALTFLIPSANPDSSIKLRDLLSNLDGLVLQGGSDVAPQSYGEEPLKPEWKGDFVRDCYEIELFKECVAQNKPVLGVCRGLQLINVATGGTLYQDIGTQVSGALTHRDWEIYDQNFHEIQLMPGSRLEEVYEEVYSDIETPLKVNSVHHQAIKKLGKDLIVEARTEKDGLIEAVRLQSDTFVSAVQWHPEFHDPEDLNLLDSTPLLEDFLDEVRKRKEA